MGWFLMAARKPKPKRKLLLVIEQLRDLRVKRNETQGSLAKRMGYSIDAIESWESGRKCPRSPALSEWAEALGKTLTLS
jgi:DNA-binding transcriptional regulator YiaG